MAFDLRKQPQQKKQPYWLYALIAILLVGGTAWWFYQPKEQTPELTRTASPVPVEDTVAQAPGPAAQAPVDTPVIAASFEAGSTTPQVSPAQLSAISTRTGKIHVFGYASSEGDLDLNQTISQARADAYKKVLLRNGIAGSLVSAEGKGIADPIASNETEEGRRKNRRVEVRFQN